MVSMCHASLFHWQQRPDCTSRNLSIGYWQLSRVYAVLGQANNAREAAKSCSDFSKNEGAFLRGYAYEALARAEFLAGNDRAGEHFLGQARIQLTNVTDVAERGLLARDLETMKATTKPDRSPLTRFELDAVRNAVIAEIYCAFQNVTREGGVSWGESVVLDDYGGPDECEAARMRDTDANWGQLVDNKRWVPECGSGGFNFLDSVGFRYYLPPAMVRSLQSGQDEGIRLKLSMLRSRPEQFSLLDQRQRLCIARFLLYMARHSDEPYLVCNDKDEWLATLNAGWWEYLDDELELRIE